MHTTNTQTLAKQNVSMGATTTGPYPRRLLLSSRWCAPGSSGAGGNGIMVNISAEAADGNVVADSRCTLRRNTPTVV